MKLTLSPKNEDFLAFLPARFAGELLDRSRCRFGLEERRTEQVAKIGENIQISRSAIPLTPDTSRDWLSPMCIPVPRWRCLLSSRV